MESQNSSITINTGCTLFQINNLNEQIEHLTNHMKTHKKDKHSLRGLYKKVGQRNRLLKYVTKNPKLLLKVKNNNEKYSAIFSILSNKMQI